MNNGYQPINAKLLSEPMCCGNCNNTDGMYCYSNPPKVKCIITGEYHYYNDKCNCTKKIENKEDKSNDNKMTIDKLIEICEREYKRGMHTASSSKFDEGYAHAMRLCLSFARELKESMKGDE